MCGEMEQYSNSNPEKWNSILIFFFFEVELFSNGLGSTAQLPEESDLKRLSCHYIVIIYKFVENVTC